MIDTYIALDETVFLMSPSKLIDNIKKLDTKENIKGIEFTLSRYTEEGKKYILKFVALAKLYNLGITFHGAILDSPIEEHLKLLELYHNVSILTGKKVNVTYSSCLGFNLNKSIEDSKEKLIIIVATVMSHNLNVEILMENSSYYNKPSFEHIITKILPHIDNLKLSYNIGHASLSGIDTYTFPEYISNQDKDKLLNIYVHDNDNTFTHMPFNYGNIDLYEVNNFIKDNNYTGIVTLDCNINKLTNSEYIEDKLKAYVTEVNKVKYILA